MIASHQSEMFCEKGTFVLFHIGERKIYYHSYKRHVAIKHYKKNPNVIFKKYNKSTLRRKYKRENVKKVNNNKLKKSIIGGDSTDYHIVW